MSIKSLSLPDTRPRQWKFPALGAVIPAIIQPRASGLVYPCPRCLFRGFDGDRRGIRIEFPGTSRQGPLPRR